jgi:hypothetical protein
MVKKNILNQYSYIITILIIFIILLFLNIIYTYSTYFEKIIKVKELNILRSYKRMINIVNDYDGNVYIVSNSLYYGFFKSTELYTMFDVNKSYKITGYGYRIPILGFYPSIISAKEL